MNLAVWMKIDGYFKLAIITMTLFFSLAAREIMNHHMLVVCESIILRLYYLFLFGWMVSGAVQFWSYVYPRGYCDQEFGNYMWALLIISFILIPINLFFTRFRA